MTNKAQVAERVRGLRLLLGLTQEQVAERGGVDRVEISKVEGGKNYASSFEMRTALAAGFGLTLENVIELLDGDTAIETLKRRCRIPAAERRATGTDGR